MIDDDFYATFSVAFRHAFGLCPRLKYIDVGHNYSLSGTFQRLTLTPIGKYGDLVWKRRAVHQYEVQEWTLLA